MTTPPVYSESKSTRDASRMPPESFGTVYLAWRQAMAVHDLFEAIGTKRKLPKPTSPGPNHYLRNFLIRCRTGTGTRS